MTTPSAEKAAKIDAMMEQASQALVKRQYFEAEKLALSALRRAYGAGDYERIARIVLPLQEARRQKRDLAIDSGNVFIVDGELPQGRTLKPGCYLLTPPRVGIDGRTLRELADERHVPVVVVVREPTSREGLWPLVAVGPVTFRTKVDPPKPRPAKVTKKKTTTKKTTKVAEPSKPAIELPEPEWFVYANEALGDAAISQILATDAAALRVDALMDRLEAQPDHEKLHQRLGEAAREAAREPVRKRRALDPDMYGEGGSFRDEFDDEDDDLDDE